MTRFEPSPPNRLFLGERPAVASLHTTKDILVVTCDVHTGEEPSVPVDPERAIAFGEWLMQASEQLDPFPSPRRSWEPKPDEMQIAANEILFARTEEDGRTPLLVGTIALGPDEVSISWPKTQLRPSAGTDRASFYIDKQDTVAVARRILATADRQV
ncbi:MAG TPA: hypothetical protein VK674_06595 [Candidatus Limnocylindria bacterium]|nr:hypothetical protein [Candidatus Limnocylindria bacterium]